MAGLERGSDLAESSCVALTVVRAPADAPDTGVASPVFDPVRLNIARRACDGDTRVRGADALAAASATPLTVLLTGT